MTIAILSWGAHRTLLNTLRSYQALGIDQTDDEKIIWFQEIGKSDQDIAKKYGYEAYGSPTNIGIAAAYRELVNIASGEFFLFLENDWVALDGPDSLFAAQELLYSRVIDLARLRHRRYPGHPLWTLQYQGYEDTKPTHLLDSIHWTDPSRFSGIEPNGDGWFIASSRNANWTNNPHMAKTEWLKDNIIPRLGNSDIEMDLQPWWEQQDFIVGQGSGIFTHKRIG